MPTPVSAARQCLTADAASTLDAAISVARRRTHPQTTSLHAVSALLAPSSPALLRDACSRARNLASPARLQIRALELCLAIALDRLPTAAQPVDEPPVSNSLMAAIKRSQAIQRRNPDALTSPRMSSPPDASSAVPLVMVELRQLVLSILDDPVVSRVFCDAGIRSTDVKLAILCPPAPRVPRSRFPPLFLCNFAGSNLEPSSSSDFDDSCRRIRDVLLSGRNPFLIGSSSREAVLSFRSRVESGGGADFPPEIAGMEFVTAEKEVAEGSVGARLGELVELASESSGGVVVDVGDLADFPAECGPVVAELTSLLELHHSGGGSDRCRLWLVGSAANYETYMKFLSRHPMAEKDLNLQLLPVTSFQSGIGGSKIRPSSLMESFVPFGGFFSSISDFKTPLSNIYQPGSRCHQCEEKYEQELSSLVRRPNLSAPQQPSLPSWLQRADTLSSAVDQTEAKDDGTHMCSLIMALQRKWNENCQRLHRSNQMLVPPSHLGKPTVVPAMVGFPLIADRTEKIDHHVGNGMTTPSSQSGDENMLPNRQDISLSLSKSQNENLLPSAKAGPIECEQLQMNNSEIVYMSPLSTSPVATDLRLGTSYHPLEERLNDECQNYKERLKDSSGCSTSEADSDSMAPNMYLTKKGLHASRRQDMVSSDSMAPNMYLTKKGLHASRRQDTVSSDSTKDFDPREFKSLLNTLMEKVGRQEAAICAISKTVAYCKSGNKRRRSATLKGDIWLNFAGPDRAGKKKVAKALAEFVFGSRKNMICVDLNSQHCRTPLNTVVDIGQDVSEYDSHRRGQMAADYIAGELRKKPLSVVFLDNIDKADMSLQTSLICAVQTGKFPDSHGRQVGINNAIFITATKRTNGKPNFSGEDCCDFSEENVMAAQACQLQILIGCSSECPHSYSSNVIVTSHSGILIKRSTSASSRVAHKRKLEECRQENRKPKFSLDLNLSVEEMGNEDEYDGDEEKECTSESSEAWLEEFYDLVDTTINFERFDFDNLADDVLSRIGENFRSAIGSEGKLEIESRCMEQILAAAWICEEMEGIQEWIDKVLSRSFVEAKERCTNLSAPVLRLVSSEEHYEVERIPEICLPARVVLK